ncbi:MAG: superoxide dismutase family protein [Lachnospiraceae bacterium]
MRQITPSFHFIKELYRTSPDAAALIAGNADYPSLTGTVSFYQSPYAGLLIQAEVWGLPVADSNISADDSSASSSSSEISSDDIGSFFFAMHIHEYGDCTPPFDKTGMHYNPGNSLHPQHAGDLVPLLGNQGYAWCVFYDERFSIPEIIGKSVIIHRGPDDFHTQPAGNAGEKIGCGTIEWVE